MQPENVELNKEVLTPSDIYLANELNDILVEDDKPDILSYVSISPNIISRKLFTDGPKQIIELLYVFLPIWLNKFYNTKYSKPKGRQLLTTKILKEKIKGINTYLKNIKKTNADIRKSLFGLSKYQQDNDSIDYIEDLVEELKVKYYPLLKGIDKKIFYKFYKVYRTDEYDKKDVGELLRNVNSLEPKKLRLFVKSIDDEEVRPHGVYLKTKPKLNKASKKLFNTITPSTDQIDKIAKRKPAQYTKWRDLCSELNRKIKESIESEWVELGWDIVDVKIVNKLFKKLKIQTPIDKGYEGKVSLGATSSFIYYTSDGLELKTTPGRGVIMNPNYDENVKGNQWYCKSFPFKKTGDKRRESYTFEHGKKSKGDIYAEVGQIGEVIEEVRSQLRKDIKSKKKDRKKLASIICRLGDLTYGRIGNPDSEENGVYGLHNLLSKHVKHDKANNRIIITYIGKKKVPQKHVVYDEELVKLIRQNKKGKKPNDYLFSHKGNKISTTYINKYLRGIGFPSTFHRFRTYHACRMFSELITYAKKEGKKWTEKKAIAEFKKQVLKIGKKLGHQFTVDKKGIEKSSMAIKEYISPALMISFFKLFKMELPDYVKEILKQVLEE